MKIQKISNKQSSFTAKFVPNKAFKEVVAYAESTKQLRALDSALNSIRKANEGDILIVHGSVNNHVFSNFTLGKRSVYNANAQTPEEASFNGILDLGTLGSKFRKLVGGNVKENITANDIMQNYTTKIDA